MSKTIKAAVIGCGGAARIDHIRWYAQHLDVALVGLADINEDVARFCAEKWGGKPYKDAEEMLKVERPDVVSVASPVAKHAEHTVLALEHGAHVLCEKPMAPTLEDCDQMIDAAERNGKILSIAFHKRHNVGTLELYRRLKAGEIGKPIFGRTHWTMYAGKGGGFRRQLVTGGGCFQDHGSHWIDQYRWYIGDVRAVQGLMKIWYPDAHEVEDYAVATLEFEGGFNATIEATWVGPARSHGQLEETYIYGTEGALFISLPPWTHYEPPILRQWVRDGNQWIDISLPADMLFLDHYHYKRQIDDWIRCVLEGDRPKATGHDGRKVVETVLALYQAHDTGQKVTLPLKSSPDIQAIFTHLRKA
jgi:predicted dehydrogenase